MRGPLANRPAVRAALSLALLALLAALSVPADAAANAPWWRIDSGSRPTNLWKPTSELQELRTQPSLVLVELQVEGQTVGCMGEACPFLGLANDEDAAAIQASLETAYGAGDVVVREDEATPGRFTIESVADDAGRFVPQVEALSLGAPGEASARVLTEGGSGRLALTVTNLGDAPAIGTAASPITVTDSLPPGFSAAHAEAFAGSFANVMPTPCSVAAPGRVTCTFEGTLEPYEAVEVEVFGSVEGEPPAVSGPGRVEVAGGNAPADDAAQTLTVSPDPAPFGIESYAVEAEEEGGRPAHQAAEHPFQVTTALTLNQGRPTPERRGTSVPRPPAPPRNFRFQLPAGLVGNATKLARCSFDQFTNQVNAVNECPAATAIGAASVTVFEKNTGLVRFAVPIFNLVPTRGEPARFGFIAGGAPVTLDPSVRTGDGYGITVSVDNASQAAMVLATTATLWGVPGDPRHDASRGWGCVYAFARPSGCSRPPGLEEQPFLRLPTSCAAPLTYPMALEPWNTPAGSAVSTASFTSGALVGCNRPPFDPSLEVSADTHAAESPLGLGIRLRVPQEAGEAPGGIATADVRSTELDLPPGLTLNPAGATGLVACSQAQVGFERLSASGEAVFDERAASCPDASKLGTVEVETPLLDEPLIGSVYQAAQGANPFGSLLALYIVAEAPLAGVRVKLASEVTPTPGGLVATVEQTPQLPFEEFSLQFFGGPAAPLATTGCGAYRSRSSIAPWSGQPASHPEAAFTVDSGPGGGACADPPPFAPRLTAGTEVPIAGSFSHLLLRLDRDDGTGQLASLEAALPPGLTGKLAGIPACPEAGLRQAEARTREGDGALERANPSCPAASRVGAVEVAAGVGPKPVVVHGDAYLAGPYKGAPVSLAVITPAIAGPFDLGVVTVRVPLYVDPISARITARSDAFPSALHGIPLDLRTVAVSLDRPSFTLNPTSCTAKALTASARSTLGQSSALASRFQVGACGALAFEPALALRLRGGTGRDRNPALTATLRYPRAGAGSANLAAVSVALPHSQFLDNAHIRTICTRVRFAAEACPPGSIYGHASALSPLLDHPLTGNVYLRSSSHRLPDLVADLRGPAQQPIEIVLDGRIDSVHGGIRTTFSGLPDVPVSRFTLSLKGGSRGLLVNSRDLCRGAGRAAVRMEAQDGRIRDWRPPLAVGCDGGSKNRN